MTRRNHTAGPVRVLLREIWLVWLLLAALHIATAQPFATGPKLHPPAPGQNVDARLVLEDAAKFVWVSGPDGTFRYDGVRYVPAAVWGLPMGEASQMDVAGGAVWVLLERDLWWFDGARFRQFPGAYDGIVGAGDLLYVDLTIGRRISVLARKDTGWELLSNSTVHPRHHQMQAGEDGRIWYGAFSALSWTKWTGTGWEYGSLPTTRKIDELWQAAPVGNNDFLTTNGHVIIRFRRDASGGLSVAGSTASESRHPREHVFPSRYGTWVLVKGMMMQLLPDGLGVNYFRYAGPYKVFSLRAGRTVLWAAAGPAGLMAFSRSQSIEWIQPETGALGAAKAVARSGSRLFFGRADVTYEVLPDSSTWDPGLAPPIPIATARPFGLPASLGPYEDTAVGPDGSLWHIQPKEGAVRVSAGGAWLGTAGGPPGPPGKAQMRKLAFSDDGRVWVASRQNLWEVLVRPTPDYLYRPGGSWQGQRHIADFFRDAGGRLYAAADNGLLRYESGVWREQPLPRCLLSTQLRTAAVATEESLWFAYRDRPGFTRAYRLSPGAPWQCNHFTGQNGFPGPTGFLRIDRQHRLWRGAGQTIQFAPLSAEGAPMHWTTLGEADGLYDGEPTAVFAEEPDGSVLVGSGHTLQKIPAALWAPALQETPTWEGAWVSGSLLPIGAELEVQQGAAPELWVSTLPVSAAALNPRLEYRAGGDWEPLPAGGPPLNDLPAGAHELAVRYAGSEKWIVLPVRVNGVWWRSLYARAGLAALACLSLWALAPLLGRLVYRFNKWRYVRSRTDEGPLAGEDKLPEWTAGAVLRGKYEIEGLLATGGFSDVYSAADRQSGAAVVIKRLRLPARAAAKSPSWLRTRFLREVGVVSLIHDDGILPVVDTWFDDAGIPHIVLPKVSGVTLRQYLDERAPLPREEAAHLLGCLAQTLHAAHERGVVHCDLKPENILIPVSNTTEFPRPIVIDFGTAALHLQTDVLSETTLGAGSIRYMAPEQMLGRYSPASDVYAFASIALEVTVQASYASLDLTIDRNWEANFRQTLAAFGLRGQAADLLVGALRWDPTQRCSDVSQWTRDFLACLPGKNG